jgi:hypothetical protein
VRKQTRKEIRSAVGVRSSALQKCSDLQENRHKDEDPVVAPGLLYTNPYTNATHLAAIREQRMLRLRPDDVLKNGGPQVEQDFR